MCGLTSRGQNHSGSERVAVARACGGEATWIRLQDLHNVLRGQIGLALGFDEELLDNVNWALGLVQLSAQPVTVSASFHRAGNVDGFPNVVHSPVGATSALNNIAATSNHPIILQHALDAAWASARLCPFCIAIRYTAGDCSRLFTCLPTCSNEVHI